MVRTSPFHGNNMGSNPIGGKNHAVNISFMETNFIKGYVYIRNPQTCDAYDAGKIGKTSDLFKRDKQYATDELRGGYSEAVFEVPNKETGNAD